MIDVKKDLTIADLHKAVWNVFLFDESQVGTPIELTRMREWHIQGNHMGKPIGEGDSKHRKIEEMGFQSTVNVTLEIQNKDSDDFEKWEGLKIMIELVGIDDAGEFTEPRYEMMADNCYVAEVRKRVAQLNNVAPTQVGLAKLDFAAKTSVLLWDENRLNDYGLKAANLRVHFEIMSRAKPFGENVRTPGQRLLTRFDDMISIIPVTFNELINPEKIREIRIDLRKSLGFLRARIAKELEIPVIECRLCKYFTELKDDEKTLLMYHFDEDARFEGPMVQVARGRVLKKFEFNVKIFELLKKGDQECQQFQYVNDVIMCSNWSVPKIREEIRKVTRKRAAGEEQPFRDIAFFRVRNKKGSRMLGPLLDDRTLKKNCPGLSDGYQLVVQPSSSQERFTENTLLVNVARWDPAKQKIGEVAEIRISIDSKLESVLKRMLSAISDIPPDRIVAIHPYAYQVEEKGTNNKLAEQFSIAPEKFGEAETLRTWKVKNADYILYKDSALREAHVAESPFNAGLYGVDFNPSERGFGIFSVD